MILISDQQETVMVVGIDSFHDISKGKRSIGGFVASTNPELTRWFSRVKVQMVGQELVPNLKINMIDSLQKYHEVKEAI